MRTVIHLPSPRTIILQGGAHLLETALAPIGLFYGVLVILGFGDGVIAAMAWALAAIAFRLLLRKKIPIMLLGTTALLAARTVLGLATGSEFLYFLQPTLQNFVLALIFVLSTPFDRPLLARLAAEVCSFPEGLAGHPRLLRFPPRLHPVGGGVRHHRDGDADRAAQGDGGRLRAGRHGRLLLVGRTRDRLFSLLWFRHALRAEQIVLRLGPPEEVQAA